MALAFYDDGMAMALTGPSSQDKIATLSMIAEMGETGAAFAGDVAKLLNDRDDLVVLGACEALAMLGEAGVPYAQGLAAMLSSPSERKKCFAAGALGIMGPSAAKYEEDVAALLASTSHSVKAASVLALGSMKIGARAGAIAGCLSDSAPDVVNGAITALTLLEDEGKPFAGQVAAKLSDPSKDIKTSAVMYFAKFDDLALANVGPICALLKDEDAEVRQSVVDLFAALKDKAAPMLPAAASGLTAGEARARAASALAIGSVGPAASSQAGAVAALLSDTAEDKTQLVKCVAGIECKAPMVLAIPAAAAATALASIGDKTRAPEIAKLTASGSMDVRIAAAKALGELGAKPDDALPLLDDPVGSVRAAACDALAALAKQSGPDNAVASRVCVLLSDTSPIAREAAAAAMGCMGDEGAAHCETLKDMIDTDRAVAVRCAALRAMGGVGKKGQVYAPDVCRCIYDEFPEVRAAAMAALSEMGEKGACFADEVADMVVDGDESVRAAAVEALGKMGESGKEFMGAIEGAVTDPSKAVQKAARAAAAKLGAGAIME